MWQYHLFILNRPDGTDLAGVNIYPPSGRVHRMRRRDTLLLYLHQAGNAPLPASEQRALLDRLARRYFSLSGSVTSALKDLATNLNAFYLNRNRKLAAQGKQSVGWLGMAVWRGNNLYVALSGPMHAAVLGDTTRHIHDPQMSGRGLGMGRAARVYFSSATVQPGDVLVMAPNFPPAWDANILRLDANRRISPLLRRMTSYGGATVQSAIVQIQPGAGEIKRKVVASLSGHAAAPPEDAVAQEPAEAPAQAPTAPPKPEPAAAPPSRPPQPQPAEPRGEAKPAAGAATPPPRPPTSRPAPARPTTERPAAPRRAAERAPKPASASSPSSKATAQAQAQATPPRERQAKKPRFQMPHLGVGERIRRAGASLWRGAERILSPLGSVIREAFNVSPDEIFALPRSFMAITAIAVPLVVVTIAVVVFFRQGRHQQYQAYFAKAQIEAQQALEIEEPITRHNALEQALSDLETAQTYERTPESEALFAQVQSALDELDGVQRLELTPASSRLPAGTHIKRLLVVGANMYALDETTGKVFYLRRDDNTGRYILDKDFDCGPDEYGQLKVGPLVDIAALPITTPQYKLVGVDANAHFVLCAPGENPHARPLPEAQPHPWSSPTALAYVNGDLYVLDPAIRAVEIISNGPQFDATPYNYFQKGAPAGIETAIDMAVLRGALYLLHQDGQVTRCTRTATPMASTEPTVKCDALTYEDPRPGRQSGPIIPDVRFTQIRPQPPPDPSLYFLDISQNAIYRFTLQLQFVAQYRPQQPLKAPVSAFAIDPDAHLLFWAAGDRIYQAPLE